MVQKVLKPIQNLACWFFGAPFGQLPPEFDETIPADLRAFEPRLRRATSSQEVSNHHFQPVPNKPSFTSKMYLCRCLVCRSWVEKNGHKASVHT